MQRHSITPRVDWQATVEACGLVWHSVGTAPYWNEAAYYSFQAWEIDAIETATRDLYGMLLAAGDYVIDQQLLGRFGVPAWCEPLIAEAWRTAPPALNYGRFDLGYDGKGPPKLFEFNCDTPTSLVETAVAQWLWKEEVFPHDDQFNSLHDKLIAKWRDIAPWLASQLVHFAHVPDRAGEETLTTAYMMDLAREAGLQPVRIAMRDIGWAMVRDADFGAFYDLDDREIRTLYKLYPWEWLVTEPFGTNLARNATRTTWIEPVWKMIWSNKAILPLLWDLYPRHPNLLWCRTGSPASSSYVRKPMLAREGGNVMVVRDGRVLAANDGPYTGPSVYQDLFDLPDFDGARPVSDCDTWDFMIGTVDISQSFGLARSPKRALCWLRSPRHIISTVSISIAAILLLSCGAKPEK